MSAVKNRLQEEESWCVGMCSNNKLYHALNARLILTNLLKEQNLNELFGEILFFPAEKHSSSYTFKQLVAG